MSSDFARVERAIRYLETNLTAQPSLGEVAKHIGLSEAHFQRLFQRWAGVSPKSFLQSLTLARAKQLLGSASTLETSLAVGLSSQSRLHDLFLDIDRLTPGEFKARQAELRWGMHETMFGPALFVVSERGLCEISFVETPESTKQADSRRGTTDLRRIPSLRLTAVTSSSFRSASPRSARISAAPLGPSACSVLEKLAAHWPQAKLREDRRSTAAFAKEIDARMRGGALKPLSVVLRGTPFQVKVWEALLRIPEGHCVTYGTIATELGMPSASRAVGAAVGANLLGYLVPCHRVIRSTGAVGDYAWGPARKHAMLAVERARRSA